MAYPGLPGTKWHKLPCVAQAQVRTPCLDGILVHRKSSTAMSHHTFHIWLSLPSDIKTKSRKGDPCCCTPGKRCRQHRFPFYASHFLLHISQKTKNLQYLSPGEKKEPKGITRKATARRQYFLLNSPCALESTPSSFGAGLHLSLPPQLHWRLKCILKM